MWAEMSKKKNPAVVASFFPPSGNSASSFMAAFPPVAVALAWLRAGMWVHVDRKLSSNANGLGFYDDAQNKSGKVAIWCDSLAMCRLKQKMRNSPPIWLFV